MMDNDFKMEDIDKDAVGDILERLKSKRTMNNKEVYRQCEYRRDHIVGYIFKNM